MHPLGRSGARQSYHFIELMGALAHRPGLRGRELDLHLEATGCGDERGEPEEAVPLLPVVLQGPDLVAAGAQVGEDRGDGRAIVLTGRALDRKPDQVVDLTEELLRRDSERRELGGELPRQGGEPLDPMLLAQQAQLLIVRQSLVDPTGDLAQVVQHRVGDRGRGSDRFPQRGAFALGQPIENALLCRVRRGVRVTADGDDRRRVVAGGQATGRSLSW